MESSIVLDEYIPPCDFCGDYYVTWRSHQMFCEGFSKRPWEALPLTPERISLWKGDPGFRGWAKRSGIKWKNVKEASNANQEKACTES